MDHKIQSTIRLVTINLLQGAYFEKQSDQFNNSIDSSFYLLYLQKRSHQFSG